MTSLLIVPRHGLVRFAVAIAAMLAATLVLAAPAWSHAALKSVTPADRAKLQEQPAEVTIAFTADIEETVKEATLLPPTGDPITDAWKASGKRITIAVPAEPVPGTWGVRWRVLGGDGHPLTGSTTFVVEGATGGPAAAVPGEAAPDQPVGTGAEPAANAHAGHAMVSTYPHTELERVALVGRILFFAGLLLFVGGVLFAVIAAPGWQPRFWNSTLLMAVLGAWIVWGTHAAMIEERSPIDMVNPLAWLGDVISVGVRGYVLAAALLLIVHAVRWQLGPREWEARDAGKPIVLLAVVMAAAAAPSLSGHAADGNALWLRIPLDMLHVLAGAAWLGGLVQLLTIAKRERSLDPRMRRVVNRYSRVAAVSVGVLVITGVFATFDELDAGLGELVGSDWGRLIIAKAALLVATMPLANANRLRNVPDVSRDPVRGVPRLRRFVAIELVIIVWVVGATAMLVYETPPKEERAVTAASSTPPTAREPLSHVGRERRHDHDAQDRRGGDDGGDHPRPSIGCDLGRGLTKQALNAFTDGHGRAELDHGGHDRRRCEAQERSCRVAAARRSDGSVVGGVLGRPAERARCLGDHREREEGAGEYLQQLPLGRVSTEAVLVLVRQDGSELLLREHVHGSTADPDLRSEDPAATGDRLVAVEHHGDRADASRACESRHTAAGSAGERLPVSERASLERGACQQREQAGQQRGAREEHERHGSDVARDVGQRHAQLRSHAAQVVDRTQRQQERPCGSDECSTGDGDPERPSEGMSGEVTVHRYPQAADAVQPAVRDPRGSAPRTA